MQRVTILGSTGSIGQQTLDVIAENSDKFEVVTLTANNDWERLAEQAIKYDVDSVVIVQDSHYQQLKERLAEYPIKVYVGEKSLEDVASNSQVDVVVNALVGYSGLHPTVAAIKAGKKVALANKESLVVGGEYVMQLAREKCVPIVPIDSEHSAILQCLMGECSPIRKVILTCSGGSFRDFSRSQLYDVTVEQALKHPQWRMGAKITIDSSTLVNKGFEVIEAKWLFGLTPEQIDVIQHPQSVVHSMVEFEDGAIKAQLGTPDMRMPISLALMFPHRAQRPTEQFSFLRNPMLTFEQVDREKYPALDIAYDCMRRGGTAACTMNGSNEIAVEAFLNGRCKYLDIVKAIEYALTKSDFTPIATLAEYAEANRESRELAREILKL